MHSSWFPVLKRHIDEEGGDVWRGVGRYNARSVLKQRMYIKKVKLALKKRG